MAATDEAQAKQYLLSNDEAGYSVYEHIFNLVTTSIDKNPQNILKNVNKLPEYSKHVKGHRFKGERPACKVDAWKSDADAITRAGEEKALFDRPAPEVYTVIEQPTPFTTVTTTTTKPFTVAACRPLTEDKRYHKLCGVGMPAREYFLLEQAISKLIVDKGIEEVVCFGKIFGTKQNYIVVRSRKWFPEETKVWQETYAMPKPPRKGLDVPMQPEPPGIGLNRYTFWICHYAGGPWSELPDVTPQQISCARKIRKFFTGDLEAAVQCHPPFPGREAGYLRAQLARITAATSIAPEGEVEVYEAEDDAEEEDEDPNKPKPEKYKPLLSDPKPVSTEDGIETLASRDKWVHTGMYIYKSGRGTMVPPKPEVEGEEEPEPEEDEAEEKEPEEEKKELLQPLAGDSRYAAIKIPQEPKEEEEGEEAEEKEEEEEKADEGEEEEDNPGKLVLKPWKAQTTNNHYKKHGVVVVKSLRWPGSSSWVSSGNISGNIYFGYGLKDSDSSYSPCVPPPVQTEAVDITEMADPTSMTEKLILRGEEPKEGDSEDEKEEEEEEAEA